MIYATVQAWQIHPNAIHTILSLIILCRLACEMMSIILSIFFSSLHITNNNLSLRPQKNIVELFDSPPNRVDFKSRWVVIESKINFPFHPLIGEKYQWTQISRNLILIPAESRFMTVVTRDLGSDPQTQTKVYSITDLLSDERLAWCDIGPGLELR